MKITCHLLLLCLLTGFTLAQGPPAISDFDEYNQWKEALGAQPGTDPATFVSLPGFEVELLRSARPNEGSWVSMAFDNRGRLIVARESAGLVRFGFKDGQVEKVEVINETLKECRGLLYAYDRLYANANNSKGLFQLRDTNGDDQFDEVKQLIETPGGVGHGRNDLALGPDGMIYAIHGDSVQVPDRASFLPVRLPGPTKPQGFLMRTDRDGKAWEVVSMGLRNPYGIAFNPDGDAFTYDADAEAELGLPSYRPTRVLHLVSGSNYGWRQGDPHLMGYAPDCPPAVVDVGRGSPCAVKFGIGSKFPKPFQEALFILDWAFGRILAVHLSPEGAGYRGRTEVFLRGRPLNVTDLEFGSDGAMYFCTGGRKTQSALYRVRYTGKLETASSSKANLDPMKVRRTLETFHGGHNPAALDLSWPRRNDPDPLIAFAARTAIESQPVDTWRARVLEGEYDAAGYLMLSRVGHKSDLTALLPRVIREPFTERNGLVLLRIYDLILDRLKPEDTAPIVQRLNDHYPHPDPTLNRELARVLSRTDAPGFVAKTLKVIRATEAQPEKLLYLDTLTKTRTPLTAREQKTFFELVHQARRFRGDRNLPGYVSGLKKRAVARLAKTEKRELEDWISGKAFASSGEEPTDVKDRTFVRNWTMPDLAEEERGPGNLKKGAVLFEAALCSRCHQIGDLGTPVGPNLTAVSSRFNRQDLLESIVDPSKVVAEVYRNHFITTKDGVEVVGRVMMNDFRESELHVAPNPFDPTQIEKVNKRDIKTHTQSDVSPMPPGLLNTLTRAEIRDLLAFIESGGGADD